MPRCPAGRVSWHRRPPRRCRAPRAAGPQRAGRRLRRHPGHSPGRPAGAPGWPVSGIRCRRSPRAAALRHAHGQRGKDRPHDCPGYGGPAAPAMVCGPLAAQAGAVVGDQAAPDTMLADVPVPQRQLQTLGAHRASGANGDRRGRLLPGPGCVDTDWEPFVGARLLSAHRAYQETRAHNASSVSAGSIGAIPPALSTGCARARLLRAHGQAWPARPRRTSSGQTARSGCGPGYATTRFDGVRDGKSGEPDRAQKREL